MITADNDSVVVFSILVVNKRPDLTIWNERDKKVILLQLKILWEKLF